MRVFTIGQVAKICKIGRSAVTRWFDFGRLKGYRIPGSQDRRIPRKYLIEFLKEYKMPLGDLEDDVIAKVLIVSQDQGMIEELKREMPSERSFKVAVAMSNFDAGIQVEGFRPDAVVVDFSIGRTEALQICRNLRHNAKFKEVFIFALLLDNNELQGTDLLLITEIYEKPLKKNDEPFDGALLAGRLRTLIGYKKDLPDVL